MTGIFAVIRMTDLICHSLHQKMKFSIKDFFSKRDQICSFLRIWPHLLEKSLMENFIVCVVIFTYVVVLQYISWLWAWRNFHFLLNKHKYLCVCQTFLTFWQSNKNVLPKLLTSILRMGFLKPPTNWRPTTDHLPIYQPTSDYRSPNNRLPINWIFRCQALSDIATIISVWFFSCLFILFVLKHNFCLIFFYTSLISFLFDHNDISLTHFCFSQKVFAQILDMYS